MKRVAPWPSGSDARHRGDTARRDVSVNTSDRTLPLVARSRRLCALRQRAARFLRHAVVADCIILALGLTHAKNPTSCQSARSCVVGARRFATLAQSSFEKEARVRADERKKMSATKDRINQRLDDILGVAWKTRQGTTVPSTASVELRDGAVEIEATYLYADMAESTLLQKRFKPEFAARVVRMYLAAAADIIRTNGGSIKSFDGDRVMGIFMGGRMRNEAVDAALKINWTVSKLINPKIEKRLSGQSSDWVVSHGIGIDSGKALLVRGGVRNAAGQTTHNDLISIGEAPNIAAKLSGFRGSAKGPIVITSAVHSHLDAKQKHPTGENMWRGGSAEAVGPHTRTLFRSGWIRSL